MKDADRCFWSRITPSPMNYAIAFLLKTRNPINNCQQRMLIRRLNFL